MKATQQKIFRERERKERRARKLLRRQKRKMATNNKIPESGELPKYSALADRLESDLVKLGDLHKQRDEFTGELGALKITRDRLSQSILDQEAPIETLSESLGELETERLVLAGSLEALGPRIARLEEAIHEILPLALETFGRLRGYVLSAVLESCRTTVRSLVKPDLLAADEHVDAIAIVMPAYVQVSQLELPPLSWSWSRELDAAPPVHWSTLARPFTEAEWAALRSETVKSMVSAANALLRAAGGILEAAESYAQGDIPPFRCEPESTPVPQSVAPLEWLQPLGGSDEEWARQICEQGGKPYPPTDPTQIAILGKMLEQRHKMPQSHGIVTGEMVGSTYQE